MGTWITFVRLAGRYGREVLVWMDLEMTGLDPARDVIVEIATIVTDSWLNVVAEGPVIAVHRSEAELAGMDEWNQKTHGRSGLIERVRASTTDEATVEQEALAFMQRHSGKGYSPMCGNTIGQDRRFMVRYMPKLEAYFHYRNIDVSTLKELGKRWNPAMVAGFKKHQMHTALADIIESIEELKYYREHFIKL